MRFPVIILLALVFARGAHAQTETIWYLDSEVPVGFAYTTPRWTPVNPADSTSRHVVNWTTDSGGLVATCYLQIEPNLVLVEATQGNVHSAVDEVAKSYVANLGKRADDVELVFANVDYADGYPVIFMERRGIIQSLGNNSVPIRVWSVVAVFEGMEVNLECGASLPDDLSPELLSFVEEEIFKILKTMRFDR